MKDGIRVQNVIVPCGADVIVPLALVYLCYIITHGHLSPGGGFQGGVLAAAVVALIALGYGYDAVKRAISFGLVHDGEGLASVVYVALAFMGVAVGAQFCQNVLFRAGDVGELYSSGTILWMNLTVGLKVFTGICSLGLLMIGVLEDLEKEGTK